MNKEIGERRQQYRAEKVRYAQRQQQKNLDFEEVMQMNRQAIAEATARKSKRREGVNTESPVRRHTTFGANKNPL